MPNGRPGDHPYTDIVLHDIDIPNEEIAEIVRDIAATDNERATKEAHRILWRAGVSSMRPEETVSGESLEQLTHDVSSLAAELSRSEEYPRASPLDACLADHEAVYSPARRSGSMLDATIRDEP